MGKAANRRRIKRARYLARLASEKPERFAEEWEKRVSSWMEQIGKDAGQLNDREKGSLPSVFERVDEAMLVLKQCGEETYQRYAPDALDLLTTECCRQFGRRVDACLFRVNNYDWFDRASQMK